MYKRHLDGGSKLKRLKEYTGVILTVLLDMIAEVNYETDKFAIPCKKK